MEVKRNENLWAAILNPSRAVEVRVWLKKHGEEAIKIRGVKYEESLLHWAALSDIGLIIDLFSAGLDINIKDNLGRTPFDWVMERYWFSCINKNIHIAEEGKHKIRWQTEEFAIMLWQNGGRPGYWKDADLMRNIDDPQLFFGHVMCNGNLWGLMDIIYFSEGSDVFKGWPTNQRTLLHSWVTQPLTDIRKKMFTVWMKRLGTVDAVDEQGRTPLWYAMDAWISDPKKHGFLKEVVYFLIKKGANYERCDDSGVSPEALLQFCEDQEVSDDKDIASLFYK